MLIAYVDETGDTGPLSKKGASSCYALGCLLLRLDAWPGALDDVVEFRRRLKTTYGIPMGAELKANYLIRNSGPLRSLGRQLTPAERSLIYRAHLRMIDSLGGRAFSVVVDKRLGTRSAQENFQAAWETLLGRLERTSAHENDVPVLVVHDDGENDAIRKVARKMRRHHTPGKMYGGGSFSLPLKTLIEDPVPRSSQNSYFVQSADLLAYAGWRTYVPPGPSVQAVVPQSMWYESGNAVHRAVNRYSGGTPGVVVR